jgi:hypothetical protein
MKNNKQMDAGSKRNNAGGFWVAGSVQTRWRFRLC